MLPLSARRMISLSLVLLSIAPLASLYLMGWFIWGGGSHPFFHVATFSTRTEDAASRLSEVMQNPDATLEDLWAVLFRERFPTDNMFATSPAEFRMHHWTIVIPWSISLVLGVLVPCALTLVSYLQGRQRRGDAFDYDHETWISRLNRKERRLSRLVLAVRNYKKCLEDKDFFIPLKEDGCKLILPAPGDALDASERRRIVTGVCAICLAKYSAGENVIWSSNRKCRHVFHEDCILSWLLRKRKQRCPCCRQPFLKAN